MATTLMKRDCLLLRGDFAFPDQLLAGAAQQNERYGPKAAPRRDDGRQRSVFVVNDRGSRMAAIALIDTLASGRIASRAASPTQQFAGQGRAWVREPAALQAILSNEAGDSTLGNAVSVSEEGCIIATPTALPGDQLEVILKFRCYSATIVCERIGTSVQERDGRTRSFSSLQFRNLTAAQVGFLRLLVDRHIQESAPLRCF